MFMYLKSIVLMFTLLFYSGCEVYDQGFDLGSGIDECVASGGNCVEPTGSGLLSLNISNPSPYSVKSVSNCRFDISGFCNEADFSENIIEYTILDPANNYNVLRPTIKIVNACKRGRFRFQVDDSRASTPTMPPYCVSINFNLLKTIRVEVVGRDLAGVEQRNPLAAQKDIDVISLQ